MPDAFVKFPGVSKIHLAEVAKRVDFSLRQPDEAQTNKHSAKAMTFLHRQFLHKDAEMRLLRFCRDYNPCQWDGVVSRSEDIPGPVREALAWQDLAHKPNTTGSPFQELRKCIAIMHFLRCRDRVTAMLKETGEDYVEVRSFFQRDEVKKLLPGLFNHNVGCRLVSAYLNQNMNLERYRAESFKIASRWKYCIIVGEQFGTDGFLGLMEPFSFSTG